MLKRKAIDLGFAAIERAAIHGARCPTTKTRENPAGGLPSGVTSELLKQGKIKVEVYAHNWRVIEILVGPHAGKRTLAAPHGRRPYLILPASE